MSDAERLQRFAQFVYDVCTKPSQELVRIAGVAYADDHQRLNHLAEIAYDYLATSGRETPIGG